MGPKAKKEKSENSVKVPKEKKVKIEKPVEEVKEEGE